MADAECKRLHELPLSRWNYHFFATGVQVHNAITRARERTARRTRETLQMLNRHALDDERQQRDYYRDLLTRFPYKGVSNESV